MHYMFTNISLRSRPTLYALCFSLLLFVFTLAGYNFDHYGSCFTASATSIVVSLACACIAFYCALFLFQKAENNEGLAIHSSYICFSLKSLFLSSAIILLAWMPYYLACFPGLYVYDAITQVYYSLGIGVINSFHPLVHTYWLTGFLSLGNLVFGSYTAGFAIYTFSQMLVMSICFAYMLCNLSQLCRRRSVYFTSLIMVCLFPVFPILAVSATKDSAFSALFSVFVVQLAKLCRHEECFLGSKKEVSILILSALLSGLFRNNAMILIVLLLLMLIVVYRSKRQFIVMALIPCLILLLLLGSVVPKKISQITSNSSEILGLPIQQIARTMLLQSDSISQDEKDAVVSMIPNWGLYNQRIVDPIKFSGGTSRAIADDLSSFLRLWAKLGFEYPRDYIDAFVAQTEGYWYIFSNYDTVGTTKPYLEFDQWEVMESGTLGRDMGQAGYDVYNVQDIENWIIPVRHSLLPSLLPVIRKLCYEPFWMNSFFLRLVTSPALVVWTALLLAIVSVHFRKMDLMIPAVTIIAYTMTCLLGPCYLIRYAFPLYCCAPIILSLLLGLFDCSESLSS